jgi:uncharacterized protein (DUF58 family)
MAVPAVEHSGTDRAGADRSAAAGSQGTWHGVTWRSTMAMRRGVLLAALPMLVAMLFGQPELVLVAVPFAIGTAVALLRRPARVPKPRLYLEQDYSLEGGSADARLTVHNDTGAPILCVLQVEVSTWIRLRHGTGHYAQLLRPEQTATLRIAGTATRWGPQRVGPAAVRLHTCDWLLSTDRQVLAAQQVSVYPASALFDSDEPLPRASGISGIHRSRRPGEGGELSDVRPFQAGDRLRRINWRVTRRTGDIHVNATLSDRDAEVLLVLDMRHEAGVSGGVDGPASVMDATVRAAAAIAEHYTHQGDRVALVEFGPWLRRVRAGTGVRHYLSILEWLVQVNRTPTGFVAGDRLFTSGMPASALVIVLTPLLDRDSARMLAVLGSTGRSLVAVDTLPGDARPVLDGPWSWAGEQLWRLERANTIGRLRELGVPVEAWQGPGSLDLMLRHVQRLVATRRVVGR